MMKRCSRCETIKPLDAFGKDRHRKDGLNCYCRECCAVAQKVVRKRCNAKRTAYNKSYRERNRDKYNAWERNYFQRNQDKLNAKGREWRRQTKGTFVIMHLSAKDRARRKGLDYVLTPAIIANLCATQDDKCALTGIAFDYSRTSEYSIRPFAPSIDRKDSTKGYTLDNVQMTCAMVNKAKNEFRQEVFDEMCLARVKQLCPA